MNIVNPKVELWLQGNAEQGAHEHVAKCASVCYKSEPKRGPSATKFYNALISSGHVSTLRHESCYYIIPDKYYTFEALAEWINSPFVEFYIDTKKHVYYVATNGNFVLDLFKIYGEEKWKDFRVSPQRFYKECPELMRYTFHLTTQISTSRELNRVSPNAISEMSTRYIGYKIGSKVYPSIVRPHWLTDADIDDWHKLNKESKGFEYLDACDLAFFIYNRMLNRGLKPEDARGVLPLDTLTEVVYTYSVREWRNIINLRYWGTTGKPHENARIIIGMVKNELEKLGYEFKNPKE